MLRVVSRTGPVIVTIIGLLFFPGASHFAAAMEDVEQARNLLKKMSAANRELNYRGIFTYEHAGIMKSVRITHAVEGGLEYERILYLNGPEREIIRAGISPGCRRFGDEFLAGVPVPSEYSSHLETHYELFLKGEDRVADRDARIIHVVPKDAMRYGYILSLDKQTGFLLQSLLVGSNRRVMERFQFVDIEFELDEGEVTALVAGTPGRGEVEVLDAGDCEQEIQEGIQWQASWLPAGFQLVSARFHTARETTMVFSDGLTFVSVFINRDGEPGMPPLQAQRGATVAQMARLNHNGVEYLICVVGEVPPPTAERIANFIVPK